MHDPQTEPFDVLVLCSSRGNPSTLLLFCIIHRLYVSMFYALDLCKNSYRSSLTSVLISFVMNTRFAMWGLHICCLFIGKTADDVC